MKLPIFLLTLTLSTLSHTTHAEIVEINKSNIEDLAQEYKKNAQCREQYGEETKVVITVKTKGKPYVYSYCSSEPGSAIMDGFYDEVLSLVSGLSAGAQCLKREYSSGGYINREYGNTVIRDHHITLITADTSISDYRTTVVTACE